MVANSVTVSAQLALPDWVRARGMSIYQMAMMGSSAAAPRCGARSRPGPACARACSPRRSPSLVLVLTRRLAPRRPRRTSRRRSQRRPAPVDRRPADGPVMVTIEYPIDGPRRRIRRPDAGEPRNRLRQGALSWGLFRDTADPRRYIEYFVDESWVDTCAASTASRRPTSAARAAPRVPRGRQAAGGLALHRTGIAPVMAPPRLRARDRRAVHPARCPRIR